MTLTPNIKFRWIWIWNCISVYWIISVYRIILVCIIFLWLFSWLGSLTPSFRYYSLQVYWYHPQQRVCMSRYQHFERLPHSNNLVQFSWWVLTKGCFSDYPYQLGQNSSESNFSSEWEMVYRCIAMISLISTMNWVKLCLSQGLNIDRLHATKKPFHFHAAILSSKWTRRSLRWKPAATSWKQ